MMAGKNAYHPATSMALPRNVTRATVMRIQYPTKKLKEPSITPMSCVHRVIIRPTGVVSNHLAACSVPASLDTLSIRT